MTLSGSCKRGLFLLMILGWMSSCAHSIHEVHVSDFTPYAGLSNGKLVRAEADQFVILGITGETDYVDQAFDKLTKTCPNGALTAITTQLSTDLGFFSWTNRALMQALCVTQAMR